VQANIQLVLTDAGFLQTKYQKAVARVAKTIPENIITKVDPGAGMHTHTPVGISRVEQM
jgi:hypothetical protein